MKIQYASDLHLEFSENKKYLSDNSIKPEGDVLLLAGDIVPFARMHKHADFFDFASDHFKATYWVPGNHEYYHSDLADRSGTLWEKIRSNVWLVNNVTVMLANIRFAFATLWTQIGPINQLDIQRGMPDFHVIQYKGSVWNVQDHNHQHAQSVNFLKSEFVTKVYPTVVVTHHVPTLLNYPEQYKGSALNEAFAVELFDLIEGSGVNYWIYGHHHRPVKAFKIGSTSLITNQLGYVSRQEHRAFNPAALIDL